MVRLAEAMRQHETLSFEVFPPKTDVGMEKLPKVLEELCKFNTGNTFYFD